MADKLPKIYQITTTEMGMTFIGILASIFTTHNERRFAKRDEQLDELDIMFFKYPKEIVDLIKQILSICETITD